MAIYRNGKEITGIYRGGKTIQEVWKYIDGAWRLVWQAVRSCFGSGRWINIKPWLNNEGWKNGKQI